MALFIVDVKMKRYLWKNVYCGELYRLSQKSLYIQPILNSSSDRVFKCVKSCSKRTLFNGGFKIYLPDHPVPQ
jgi:hypothetical protein